MCVHICYNNVYLFSLRSTMIEQLYNNIVARCKKLVVYKSWSQSEIGILHAILCNFVEHLPSSNVLRVLWTWKWSATDILGRSHKWRSSYPWLFSTIRGVCAACWWMRKRQHHSKHQRGKTEFCHSLNIYKWLQRTLSWEYRRQLVYLVLSAKQGLSTSENIL